MHNLRMILVSSMCARSVEISNCLATESTFRVRKLQARTRASKVVNFEYSLLTWPGDNFGAENRNE